MERANYWKVDGSRREAAGGGGSVKEYEDKGDTEQEDVKFHFFGLLCVVF